jgi:multiple sugar transport system substrate-binding protein
MNFSKTQILLVGGGTLIVLLIVLLFTGVIPGLRSDTANIKGELLIWGVFDSESAVRDTIIADFAKKNKNIRVTYEQKNPVTYEQDLINSLAAGTGPDVFFFKNTWLPKHGDKLLPFDSKAFPVQKLQATFPNVVTQDFSRNGSVYALPLYVDTLALLYNRTIFDNAGLPLPPKDWKTFSEDVRLLRGFDQNGRLVKAGAAIGGSSRTINEATDLLNLVMLQGGSTIMSGDGSRADFSMNSGDSVKFYTDFANPRSKTYTWDNGQHYSLDAFAEESVAMIFNYAYQVPQIRAKNPFLNLAIAPMPQQVGTNRSVNYANYWGLAVSNRTKLPEVAFSFVTDSTTDPAVNGKYLNAANRPPALLTLIQPNLDDPDFGVFVRQSLTAISWPQPDASTVDSIFSKMIDLINSGQLPIETALNQAEAEVTAIINRR